MKKSGSANDKIRLEEVRKQFVQWRDSRAKRGRIPDGLWQAASTLYPAYSVNQIAQALHLNHWEALTLFLKVPNAPLDNNLCEQALKRAILHRKNALFYKTKHGASVGDLFMSLIHTCNLAGVSAFDYLTALQEHVSELSHHPDRWMPWNYTTTSASLETEPS